jgi:hypothetical protein
MATKRDAASRRLMLAFVWFCVALGVLSLSYIIYLRWTSHWHNF